MLSSCFLNARFLSPEEFGVMDEPPFIDTDLCRGSFLLTVCDFLFFVEEQGMDPVKMSEGWGRDTQYVSVEFIEIGGDHLDQMMGIQPPTDVSILQQSAALLTKTERTLYFLNYDTTFGEDGVFLGGAAARMRDRLVWLSATLPQPHSVRSALLPPDLILFVTCPIQAIATHFCCKCVFWQRI